MCSWLASACERLHPADIVISRTSILVQLIDANLMVV